MNRVIQISKFLCKFLRHSPEKLGIQLDSAGWIDIDTLLLACYNYGFPISLNDLSRVVEQDDKQRFSIKDGKIRANQGHSIPVDLELTPMQPPVVLYHGTATRFLDSILSSGLTKQKRTHVHLTKDMEVAKSVGSRYGEPVVLIVDSYGMYGDYYNFYLTDNNVWLTDRVPVEYIKVYEL
jgi:putative RNA 2'-phosphotransferase